MDKTPTGTITPGLSWTGSNCNERELHTPQEPHNQIQFSVIPGHSYFFWGGACLTPLQGYSQYILNLTDMKAITDLTYRCTYTDTRIYVRIRNTYIFIPDIGLGVRVFANGPGDLGSIPGRVIPKTQKMVLDASLLNTQHYKVRIKGKVEQSREGVAPSPTHWGSSYRKGSLWVTLDYGRQLYVVHCIINKADNNNLFCQSLPV